MDFVDGLSIAGSIGTFIFGYIALKQKSEIEGMKSAVRVHSQATYNAWWYVGVQCEKVLDGQPPSEVIRPVSEINSISHTTRNQVIAFGREYSGTPPSDEPAWKPHKNQK
jgi:hypothetical protein